MSYKGRRGIRTLSLVVGIPVPIASCIFTGLLTSKYWVLGGLALGGLVLGHGGLALGHGGLTLGHGGLALEGLALDVSKLELEGLALGHGGRTVGLLWYRTVGLLWCRTVALEGHINDVGAIRSHHSRSYWLRVL